MKTPSKINGMSTPITVAVRLRPAETAPDAGHQIIKYLQPPAGVYAVASGHRTVITSRHKPG